jgi:hypothetical protein
MRLVIALIILLPGVYYIDFEERFEVLARTSRLARHAHVPSFGSDRISLTGPRANRVALRHNRRHSIHRDSAIHDAIDRALVYFVNLTVMVRMPSHVPVLATPCRTNTTPIAATTF